MFVNRFGSHIKTMKIILNTRDSSSGSLQRHGGQGVFNLGIVTFLRLKNFIFIEWCLLSQTLLGLAICSSHRCGVTGVRWSFRRKRRGDRRNYLPGLQNYPKAQGGSGRGEALSPPWLLIGQLLWELNLFFTLNPGTFILVIIPRSCNSRS